MTKNKNYVIFLLKKGGEDLYLYLLEAKTLQDVLTSMTQISTEIFKQVGGLIAFVFDNPILLIGFGIFFSGAIVGMFKRLAN